MKTIKIFKLSSLFLMILIATQSCMVSSIHPLYTNKDRVHKEELCGKWQTKDKTIIEITTVTDSIELETLNNEERFMLGLDKKKKEKQSITSSKKTTSLNSKKKEILSNEERFMMGLDHNKQEVKSDIKNRMKQEEYFFFPNNKKSYQIKITTKKNTSYFEGRLAKLDEYYFLDIIPNKDYLEQKLDDDYMISLVAPMHGFLKLKFINEKLKLNWIDSEDFKKLQKNKKIRLAHVSRNDREIITAKTSDIQKFLIKFADSELFNNKDAELILSPLK